MGGLQYIPPCDGADICQAHFLGIGEALNSYAIVGDDIIIFNELLAREYLSYCDGLGIL